MFRTLREKTVEKARAWHVRLGYACGRVQAACRSVGRVMRGNASVHLIDEKGRTVFVFNMNALRGRKP